MPTPPHTPEDKPPTHPLHPNAWVRWGLYFLGFVFVGIGILGVVTPGLPTTVFILMAGWCWAKSSPRFYAWLSSHPRFGILISNWQTRRAIPRSAKYLAWGMMSASCVILYARLPDERLWLAGLVSLICLMVAIWMYRLPDA